MPQNNRFVYRFIKKNPLQQQSTNVNLCSEAQRNKETKANDKLSITQRNKSTFVFNKKRSADILFNFLFKRFNIEYNIPQKTI